MPYIKRTTGEGHQGGYNYYVSEARAALKPKLKTSETWRIDVKEPSGNYFLSEFSLVLKESNDVGHDYIKAGKRRGTNLIDLILELYEQAADKETPVLRMDFDIDTFDESEKVIRISPVSYQLNDQTITLKQTIQTRRTTTKVEGAAIHLTDIPADTKSHKRPKNSYTVDVQDIEIKHEAVLGQLKQRLDKMKLPAKHNRRNLDAYTYYDDKDYFFEIKTGEHLSDKIRYAIGQLLQYKYIYRNSYSAPRLCLVFDREPEKSLLEFLISLQSLEIYACWINNGRFECPVDYRDKLLFLL